MTLTNNFNLNYPATSDKIAVPQDLQNLAVDTDYAIATLNARTSGPVLVSQAYSASGVVNVDNTTATTNLVSIPIAESDKSAVYELFMFGTYFNNSGATRTFTMNCNLGATTVLGGTTGAFALSTLDRQWVAKVRLHVFGFQNSLGYLYLPGVNGNYASAPDSAALDITGDIDIRVKVAMDDWTPAVGSCLLSKFASSTQYSYTLVLNTNGTLQLQWSPAGTIAGQITKASTVAVTVADGTPLWVRATLDVDNGASGNDVKFYTSSDGTNWTQLGATVTTAGTTSLFNSTSVLEVGTVLVGTSNPSRGKFYRAQVLNGIGGTVAFDANFETAITSLRQRGTFTESSANAATVTINRTNSQLAIGGMAFTAAGATASQFSPTMGQAMTQVYGTATEDMSTSKNLVVTFAHSAANASLRLRLLGYTLVRLVA